jgi:hypothetical protein
MNYNQSCFFGLGCDFILSSASSVEHYLYFVPGGYFGLLTWNDMWWMCAYLQILHILVVLEVMPPCTLLSPHCCLIMNRSWNILCWNVQGLNDKDK